MVPVRGNDLVRICLITIRCAAAGWFRGSGSRTGTDCTPVLWVGGNEPIDQSLITAGVIQWQASRLDGSAAAIPGQQPKRHPKPSKSHIRARRMLRPVTAINQETTGLIFSHHLCSNALNFFALSNTDEAGIRPHNHDVTCSTIRPLYSLPDDISRLW